MDTNEHELIHKKELFAKKDDSQMNTNRHTCAVHSLLVSIRVYSWF